jgi:2-polyprenyl-3-methyl-5-hydroxy-6-metoxy-1,4-benzoquinol methylase
MLTLSQRFAYLRDSAWRAMGQNDKSCPACGAAETRIVKRKHLVTELRECPSCYLRFRWPKDRPDETQRFYQGQYSQGLTTDCPDDEKLASLTAAAFRNTEKDYSSYIQVLRSLGVKEGSSILDFGCSWGYGSWQLSRAGFEVYSYEISVSRARYAAEKLQCKMIDSLESFPRKVDCFFSAHVLEHLLSPNLLWDAALVTLAPHGLIVSACPNGNPERENVAGAHYHSLWGKVHPLYITPKYVLEATRRKKLRSLLYSSPYDFGEIAARHEAASLAGDELLIVASRTI